MRRKEGFETDSIFVLFWLDSIPWHFDTSAGAPALPKRVRHTYLAQLTASEGHCCEKVNTTDVVCVCTRRF